MLQQLIVVCEVKIFGTPRGLDVQVIAILLPVQLVDEPALIDGPHEARVDELIDAPLFRSGELALELFQREAHGDFIGVGFGWEGVEDEGFVLSFENTRVVFLEPPSESSKRHVLLRAGQVDAFGDGHEKWARDVGLVF